jgi:hypothetical protein
MKKTIINISLLLSLLVTFTSCKKSLTDYYNNPEKSTTASVPTLFTGMLNDDRVRPAYWNIRTYLMLQPAIYSQTASFPNSGNAYQQNDGYTGQYWSDFYYPAGNGSGPLGTYRTMEQTYKALPADQQASQEVFMQAAKVYLYERTAKMIDAWGDIPFSQAGSLETYSTIKDPKFDDAKTLYNTLISGLNDAATYFSTASSLPANVKASFAKQDILLSGNLDMWRRYANSIRLRLLMRISFVDEATAKAAVTTMLGNSTAYPLIDGNNKPNYDPSTSDVLLQPLTTNVNSPFNAITEGDSYFAPDYMLNTVMVPANDPRIPVMFDKFGTTVNGTFVPNPTYSAMPITFTGDQQNTKYTQYAIVDSTTFLNNTKLPGILITAPEVNFLKAEAFERWGSDADAQIAYNTALQQSISFYYYLNAIGGGKVPYPSQTAIDNFLSSPTVTLTTSSTSQDKLVKIWTQKWLHFGFLQSDEAWSELRRTKYPVLNFPNQTQNGYQTPPTRLVYPSTEAGYNSNYSSVQAKDTRTTKIFWDVQPTPIK